jgi:hypothetical protein
MKRILLSVVAFGALTSFALAQPATPMDARSAPVKLTATQMDRVTSGVNETVLKRKTNPPTFTFGEFKSGRCKNLGQCKK